MKVLMGMLVMFFLTSLLCPADILMAIETNPQLSIENIYGYQGTEPLVAFYGEDNKHVFVYDFQKKRLIRFACKIITRAGDTIIPKFITFCWDLDKNGAFAVVFEKSGEVIFFKGDTNNSQGINELKPAGDIFQSAACFYLRKGEMSYLDLEDRNVYGINGSGSRKAGGASRIG